MRVKNRIPIVFELIENDENKLKFLKYLFPNVINELFSDIVKKWNENKEKIEKLWLDNPDLRLTQVLVNTGILVNYPGFWYHKEEISFIVSEELLEPREILFWGQNYDKDMNRLPKTNFILIKDMSKDHIAAILKDNNEGKLNISSVYRKAFEQELNKN